MSKERILIVEDEKIIARDLELHLLSRGYSVIGSVTNGPDAVRLSGIKYPDLVLMDIMLEGPMDGIQAAEIIAEKYDIPIVFVSSYSDHETLQRAKASFPFDYVLKPFHDSELEISIQLALHRHEANKKIIDSERRFKLLAENSPDVVYLVDLEICEMVYINRKEVFGYSSEVFKKAALENFLGEEDCKLLKSYWRKVQKGNLKRNPGIELKVKLKNGDYEWINLRQTVVEKSHEDIPRLVLTSITSITEKKTAEEQLIKTNFELDSFVYRASHDLRAPLRSILGLSNLIRIEKDDEKRMDYLDLLNKSVNKLDNFILDMTNYSRNSRLELNLSQIDFNKLIEEAVGNLAYMENSSQIRKEFIIEHSEVFYSDYNRLLVIFQNLISNSVKYQRPDITDSYLRIHVQTLNAGAHLVFEDNGVGIMSEYQEKVFDMFFRASEDSFGSGLGLYIVKQVIEKLKGTIQLISVFGKGTTVKIFLPNNV